MENSGSGASKVTSDQLTHSRALHHCSICLSPFFSTGQGHYKYHYPTPTLTHFLCHVTACGRRTPVLLLIFYSTNIPQCVVNKSETRTPSLPTVFLSVWDGTERKVSSHTFRFFPVFTADTELTAVQLLKDVPHITPYYK